MTDQNATHAQVATSAATSFHRRPGVSLQNVTMVASCGRRQSTQPYPAVAR